MFVDRINKKMSIHVVAAEVTADRIQHNTVEIEI